MSACNTPSEMNTSTQKAVLFSLRTLAVVITIRNDDFRALLFLEQKIELKQRNENTVVGMHGRRTDSTTSVADDTCNYL